MAVASVDTLSGDCDPRGGPWLQACPRGYGCVTALLALAADPHSLLRLQPWRTVACEGQGVGLVQDAVLHIHLHLCCCPHQLWLCSA